MSVHLDRARAMIDKADETSRGISYLVLAVKALCEALEEQHQHRYNSPGDACPGSHWEKTGPAQEVGQ